MDQAIPHVDPIAIQIVLKFVHSFGVALVARFVAWCLHRLYDDDHQIVNGFPFQGTGSIIPDQIIKNLINKRAGEIHRQRIASGAEGDELSDWLKAEAEVQGSIRQAMRPGSTNVNDYSGKVLLFVEKWSSVFSFVLYLIVKFYKNILIWTS